MFYNTENMYDAKDNPLTNDDDFTPLGKLRWSVFRYWKKQNDIAKVIQSVGDNYPPAIVGLCEVENETVLNDLVSKSPLRKHKYKYIFKSSKDLRGSNVALLYQRDQIKIISIQTYIPIFELDKEWTTRNILHVTGKVINGDTLDFFICHFPSRREGIKKTKPLRITCARLLKLKADSILNIRAKENIVIMGDFNDYPDDESMADVLEAKKIDGQVINNNYYNLFRHMSKDKTQGSYRYRGKWQYMDQFIINGQLLNNQSRIFVEKNKAYVYSEDYLLENDVKYGGQKPFRTYLGYKYLGGISDHLPIYLDLIIK